MLRLEVLLLLLAVVASAIAVPIIIPKLSTWDPETGQVSVRAEILMLGMPRVNAPKDFPKGPGRYLAGVTQTGKNVRIRIGNEQRDVQSDNDGHIVAEATFNALRPPLSVEIAIVPRCPTRREVFVSKTPVVANREGISVISDIDDTVKLTQVLSKLRMTTNTFSPWREIPGAAILYGKIKRTYDASFHYVSASPYRFTPLFDQYFRKTGLPKGTLDLKRLNKNNWRNFVTSDPMAKRQYKFGIIDGIIKALPNRKFILFGDAGEQDPEVYEMVHREHGNHILHVFIREVAEEGAPDHQTAYDYFENTLTRVPAEGYEAQVEDYMGIIRQALNGNVVAGA